MSDSRSCGRCIYYNSITNECGEESKCMRDVDEAKYTGYLEGIIAGAKDFAEWLCQKSDISYVNYVEFATETLDSKSIDEALSEWQKGKEYE